jgi:hypothetical protein
VGALPERTRLGARAQQLYDEGARLLAVKWDDDVGLVRDTEHYGERHSVRASLAYAETLLRSASAADIARAERIIEIVASTQETREQDAHYGNFRWHFEDQVVRDLNSVEFVLDALNAIIREHRDTLSRAAADSILAMIAIGLREIDRLDVHPSYTNIALSDICNSVLGGEVLGDQRFVDRGHRRLDDWFAFTDRSGAPHEFNSPTYAAVDIARMAALAAHTRDPEIVLKARIAEERLWLHSAAHYHPLLAQIAGPHARSYRDGWTGAGGYLKLMLWRLLGDDNLRRPTPYFPSGREEGHTGVALAQLHCPPYVLELLREKRYPFEARATTDARAGLDITTYMTESYALGSASRSYAVGDPPEPSLQQDPLHLYFARDDAPGYDALTCRYVIDDRDIGAATDDDLWDQGPHVAAQHRNRAIVAYGLYPRARPVSSYKLSVRLLGVGERTEIWCGDAPVTAFPAVVRPLAPVVIAEGAVYIAVTPLAQIDMGSDAPIELNLRNGVLTLDIYNYRGPAKTFWEYASLGGAFFKGNVRNAFIIEVAERAEHADLAAFRARVATARVTDTVDEASEREITYASEGVELVMRYSLRDMRLIERRIDGAPYAPPMARAGAIDGSGAQWLHSADDKVSVADATVMCPGAKTVLADAAAQRYVVIRTSLDAVPLRLTTPRAAIECEDFGFGRLELDEATGTLAIETPGSPSFHVDPPGGLTVTINGRPTD